MAAAAAKTDGITAEVHKISFKRSRRSSYLLETSRSKLLASLNEKDVCNDFGKMTCAGAQGTLAMKGN